MAVLFSVFQFVDQYLKNLSLWTIVWADGSFNPTVQVQFSSELISGVLEQDTLFALLQSTKLNNV